MVDFKNYKKVEDEYKIGSSSSEFMKLKEGDNIVRIVTPFEIRGIHDLGGEGNRYKSAICVGKDKGCKFCGQNLKVKVKYLGWVIDQSDRSLKILEIGHTIFKQIGELSQDPDYAFDSIPDYNVKIKRIGEGRNTEYQVIPSPKRSELSSEEKDRIDKVKPISEIIEKMKEKEISNPTNVPQIEQKDDIPVINESEETASSFMGQEDINVEDIPF